MPSDASPGALFRPGDNCWVTCASDRFGWAIDGAAYFEALRDCFDRARQEILIVGWDIDSRVELIRDPDSRHYPSPLCETLQGLVDARPGLRVHVLSWDFAMIYLLERELLPAYSFGWHDSERLHFALDSRHAPGASHHQKLVVIDGRVAFIGGIDITKNRWDTPSHSRDDSRRTDPNGTRYGPFHDIQAVVSGEAARHLRDLIDARWENAADRDLPSLGELPAVEDVWPGNIPVRASDARVALARTWADPDGGESIHEVEALFLTMIEHAESSIYVENQYFTSRSIAGALAGKLAADQGPEIVIVLPSQTSGWLEQSTMDVLRNRALQTLIEADHNDRLRILCPATDELGSESINVHAKLMIVDNRFLRIGSANLSNRSMGLDSECDIVVNDEKSALRLCSELLGEHLGADPQAIEDGLEAQGLLETIDAHAGGDRRLQRLRCEPGEQDPWLEPIAKMADLEQPIEFAWPEALDGLGDSFPAIGAAESVTPKRKAAEDATSERSEFPTRLVAWLFVVIVAGIVGAVAYSLAGESDADLSISAVLSHLRNYASHPATPFLAVPAFVIGSLVVAPVTGMIAVCALLFEPMVASLTAIAGTLAATLVNYKLGEYFSDAISAKIPKAVARRIDAIAQSSDVLSLTGLRLIPIAPFTIVNIAVGIAGVSLRQFLAATLLAMGPGVLFICYGVDRARAALEGEPLFEPWTAMIIVAAGAGLIGLRVIRNKLSGDDAK